MRALYADAHDGTHPQHDCGVVGGRQQPQRVSGAQQRGGAHPAAVRAPRQQRRARLGATSLSLAAGREGPQRHAAAVAARGQQRPLAVNRVDARQRAIRNGQRRRGERDERRRGRRRRRRRVARPGGQRRGLARGAVAGVAPNGGVVVRFVVGGGIVCCGRAVRLVCLLVAASAAHAAPRAQRVRALRRRLRARAPRAAAAHMSVRRNASAEARCCRKHAPRRARRRRGHCGARRLQRGTRLRDAELRHAAAVASDSRLALAAAALRAHRRSVSVWRRAQRSAPTCRA